MGKSPTGYHREGLPDDRDIFPANIGTSGTFTSGNPVGVPRGNLFLAVTFNAGATATVKGNYRSKKDGQSRGPPASLPSTIYYSGRLYDTVTPSAGDANIAWEIVDSNGLPPFGGVLSPSAGGGGALTLVDSYGNTKTVAEGATAPSTDTGSGTTIPKGTLVRFSMASSYPFGSSGASPPGGGFFYITGATSGKLYAFCPYHVAAVAGAFRMAVSEVLNVAFGSNTLDTSNGHVMMYAWTAFSGE